MSFRAKVASATLFIVHANYSRPRVLLPLPAWKLVHKPHTLIRSWSDFFNSCDRRCCTLFPPPLSLMLYQIVMEENISGYSIMTQEQVEHFARTRPSTLDQMRACEGFGFFLPWASPNIDWGRWCTSSKIRPSNFTCYSWVCSTIHACGNQQH